MAITPNSYLKPIGDVTLRDPQHAARLFTDDNLRLAPKLKFLFHVSFSINEAALKNIALSQRHKNEINMLVKSCDLPNFTIKTEAANQYNRKKNIQTGHSYNTINITFHDDNMGLINNLWQNYYSYYYADPISAQQPGAYNRTATRNANFINSNYGLDNGSTTPFFNSIKIYQMARGEYVGYTLHNPIISSWNHNKVDYAQGGVHDNQMGIVYEAVSYSNGTIGDGIPEGFALEHYDLTPSPLGSASDAIVADLGSASPSFAGADALNSNNINFLNNAVETVNGYSNSKALNTAGAAGISIAAAGASGGVAGLQGFAFPQSKPTSNTTVATKTKLG